MQEFDYLFNKKIAKRYDKYEIQRLSCKRKSVRERKAGAGRPFKLDLKDIFLMLLVYYRLYITYTLDIGFLFDLDQSNICRYTKDGTTNQKLFTDSTKDIQHNQKIENTPRSREIFSRLSVFY